VFEGHSELMNAALTLSLAFLSLGLAFAWFRAARGPTLPDRVTALDLAAMLTLGFTAVLSVAFKEALFLDIALAIALVAFLGAVGFARYLEKRGAR